MDPAILSMAACFVDDRFSSGDGQLRVASRSWRTAAFQPRILNGNRIWTAMSVGNRAGEQPRLARTRCSSATKRCASASGASGIARFRHRKRRFDQLPDQAVAVSCRVDVGQRRAVEHDCGERRERMRPAGEDCGAGGVPVPARSLDAARADPAIASEQMVGTGLEVLRLERSERLRPMLAASTIRRHGSAPRRPAGPRFEGLNVEPQRTQRGEHPLTCIALDDEHRMRANLVHFICGGYRIETIDMHI
jgi:hypothetical protein